MTDLTDHISNEIGDKIISTRTLAGGDISQAYLISTQKQRLFLKVNTGHSSLEMFSVEKAGLQTISKTGTIATPEIYLCGTFKDQAYLVMEHIETKSPNSDDLYNFGIDLASLHRTQGSDFGFKCDNFIGSLPQRNRKHDNWIDFYIEERLLPQFKMSRSKALLSPPDVPGEDRLMKTCSNLFGDIKPSLLHGDLWNGNYLIAKNGTAFLIDPAVYYGHHEVDIAMTKLFGGFGTGFYNSYHEQLPKSEGFEERMQIYQLYYLLVHLNLFGSSYYPSVKRILSRFF